jgi:hypothetical protein
MAACGSPYKKLEKQTIPGISALKYKPQYDKVLYRCTVNGRVIFRKFHLSGLLFFKTLENGTVRAIFQNEMGYTFFDFEWDINDSFRVNQVIPQLDKPGLIKTLQKDFNLLLMKGLDSSKESFFSSDRGKWHYNCFTLNNGVVYYITTDDKLNRIENAGKKKKVITISINGKATDKAMPDSVYFNHHRANFTIGLHKLEHHADE